jgi:hypothetical protein
MLLQRLSEEQSQSFDEQPEAAMGLHFAATDERLCLVLSGRVLMVSGIEGTERSNRLADKLWFHRDPDPISVEAESQLLMSLDRGPAPWLVFRVLWLQRHMPRATFSARLERWLRTGI